MKNLNKSPKRLKVLIPIRYPVGGIRTYLKYTHGCLDKNSFEFTLIAPSEIWLTRTRDDFGGHDVKIICTKREDSSSSLLCTIFTTLLKNKYDLIHSQGYTAGMMSIVANLFFRLPHIITLHRTFGEGQLVNTFWHKYAFAKQRIIEFLLIRADVIQAVSNDAKENLLEYFPGLNKIPQKIKVIRNGICIEQFTWSTDEADKPFVKEKDQFTIGFFGRYMPEKGFNYLIETMDIIVHGLGIDNIKVISVGGFGAFIREYQNEIQIKGLTRYFVFLDFFENIAPILKEIHILAIPSLGEACGLIAMEGLVCGTPVVAFSCLGLREVLRGTPATMVPVRDTERMAHEIIRIVNNYHEVKSNCLDFMEEAKQRFDSKKTANQLQILFYDVMQTS